MDREAAAQHRMGFRVLVTHPVIVPRGDGLVTATHRSTVLWISSPTSEKGDVGCCRSLVAPYEPSKIRLTANLGVFPEGLADSRHIISPCR